jgi:hypothetical protein
MMVGVSTDWFSGEAHDPTHQAFLAELRAHADRAGLRDVRPETTELISAADFPLVALVPVPRLPTVGPKPTLQVALSTRDPHRPVLLGGWEGWDYLLDVAEEIDTRDVPAEPVALARRAYAWLLEQLDRPVEVRTWRRRWRRPRSEWRLADTDELITHNGGLTPRRAPDAVERLR